MNANELADIQAFKTEELTIWERNHTATMLRQQQAEIEALKQIIDANNLIQNIGQFIKPTNEPVAWIGETLMGRQYINGQKVELPVGTPLYTHPVKELTDEEILELCPPNHSDMMNEAYTIDFARAILKKAEEK